MSRISGGARPGLGTEGQMGNTRKGQEVEKRFGPKAWLALASECGAAASDPEFSLSWPAQNTEPGVPRLPIGEEVLPCL